LRARGTQRGGRRRLAYAALSGCHHHDPTQLRHPAVSVECHHPYRVAVEPSLDWPATKVRFDGIGSLVQAVDREKLGFDLAAENPCPRVPGRTRLCPAGRATTAVDRTAGDDLGARGHGTNHAHVAIGESHRLT